MPQASDAGRSVCLAHGGKTPRGAASPHFKTGRFSRSLPGHLVAAYEQAARDPERLSLQAEIAVVDAMIAELLQQLDDESPDAVYRRIFRQISPLVRQRCQLVQAEVRHIVLGREVLTADEAVALVGGIVAILTRWIEAPQVQAAIAEETHALMSDGTEAPLGTRYQRGRS